MENKRYFSDGGLVLLSTFFFGHIPGQLVMQCFCWGVEHPEKKPFL